MSAAQKAWLRAQSKKNQQDNEAARRLLQRTNVEGTHKEEKESNKVQETDSDESATKLSYENDTLKLIVIQVDHKQEKRFRLQDHLFNLKIVPKTNQMPKLANILVFLHAAFLFIINKIKKFYKPEDRNIAFMTVYQSEITNGLNTGS